MSNTQKAPWEQSVLLEKSQYCKAVTSLLSINNLIYKPNEAQLKHENFIFNI